MENSILKSVKKMVGVSADYDAFDLDILNHINTVFATLNQLGIGSPEGFAIEDDTPTWDAFLGADPRLNFVKSYVYLRVRLLFDPPTTSYLINALDEQRKELEWRISTKRELEEWTEPVPRVSVDPEVIIVPSSQAWYSEP